MTRSAPAVVAGPLLDAAVACAGDVLGPATGTPTGQS